MDGELAMSFKERSLTNATFNGLEKTSAFAVCVHHKDLT